jgi:hypothetical protein
MHKLSHQVDGEWLAFLPPAHYSVDAGRLTGHLHGGDPAAFEALAGCLAAPVMLLYVLHTPRGEAEAGRYQSPELDAGTLRAFIRKFGSFLQGDARFDIWVHSPGDGATVVWDRHDDFYAYGPIERFAAALDAMGYRQAPLVSPGAHMHHYRETCDKMARALIEEFDWVVSPLRPEDEQ